MEPQKCYRIGGLEKDIIQTYFQDKEVLRDNVENMTVYRHNNGIISHVYDAVFTSDKQVVNDIVKMHIDKDEPFHLDIFYS